MRSLRFTRYNYTTPKSFLEQIDLYKHLIGHTNNELTKKMERLENGLLKLQNTSEQVRMAFWWVLDYRNCPRFIHTSDARWPGRMSNPALSMINRVKKAKYLSSRTADPSWPGIEHTLYVRKHQTKIFITHDIAPKRVTSDMIHLGDLRLGSAAPKTRRSSVNHSVRFDRSWNRAQTSRANSDVWPLRYPAGVYETCYVIIWMIDRWMIWKRSLPLRKLNWNLGVRRRRSCWWASVGTQKMWGRKKKLPMKKRKRWEQ